MNEIRECIKLLSKEVQRVNELIDALYLYGKPNRAYYRYDEYLRLRNILCKLIKSQL